MGRVMIPLVVGAAVGSALGQACTPDWETGVGNPGISSGYAAAMRVWDDGSGPALYVGGSFSGIIGVPGTGWLARYDPAGGVWSSVGGGLSQGFTNAFVTSITPFDPGTGEALVVGGFYDSAGGVPQTASLAMWDGSAWHDMGTGWTGTTRGSVWSMATWQGELFIGGGIVNTPAMIGGQTWTGCASWDGTTWTPRASVLSGFSPFIAAMVVFDDGSGERLYAAGRFDSIDGVPATSRIARYTGSAWEAVGGGVVPTSTLQGIESMTVFDDGTGPALYVAGHAFIPSGQPATNVARWDGTAWTSIGGQIGTGRITSIEVFDDGTGATLYIGGTAMPQINQLARWDGSAWSIVGGGHTGPSISGNFPSVFGLRAVGTDLYVAGNFTEAGGNPARGAAIWRGCASCYPDCDANGTLDLFDFLCFTNRFNAGDPYADCDANGTLDLFDFLCFTNAFNAGCP